MCAEFATPIKVMTCFDTYRFTKPVDMRVSKYYIRMHCIFLFKLKMEAKTFFDDTKLIFWGRHRERLNKIISRVMGKPTFCICENKDADQLCFRCIDSTIPLISKSEISSLYPSSVAVQPCLCRTRSETRC